MRFISTRDLLIIAFLLLLAWGCGGGGSQGAPVGPARARIIISPSVIDSGDRAEVEIEIFEIDPDLEEMAIKVRFPEALSYVVESAFYLFEDEFFDTGPDENANDSGNNFLVFYLDLESVTSESFALLFELEGVSSVLDGEVGVDIDFGDPEESNESEFTVTDPLFDAQSTDDIRVGNFTDGSSSSSSSSGTA